MAATHIRRFEISDLEHVVALIHQTIEESYAKFYSGPVIEFFKAFHSESATLGRSEEGDVWVMEHKGMIFGTGSTVKNEIYGVFVSPKSQRKGVGRVMMGHLEAQLYKSGYKQAELSISLPSRAFYESMGYSVTSEINRTVASGNNLRFWKAEKKLSEVGF